MQTIETLSELTYCPPEEAGTILVDYLNGSPARNVGDDELGDIRAVAEFVKRLKELDALQYYSERRSSKAKFSNALTWINRHLSRYTTTPYLSAENGLSVWDWGLCLKAKGKQPSRKSVQLWYSQAAVELLRSGRISYLKQCAQCGKWFRARSAHQKFCKADCKLKFHTSNPADKQRRAEWARKDYRKRKGTNAR